jgi:hypothetical protein
MDFIPFQPAIEHASSLALAEAHPIALEGELFRMWVRIRIHDVDLLDCGGGRHAPIAEGQELVGETLPRGHPPCPWQWTPLLQIGLSGLEILRLARQTGHQQLYLEDDGAIGFTVRDDVVRVSSAQNTEHVEVAWAELLAAWEGFADSVRVYLVGQLPALRDHSIFGAWFRGEAYLPDPYAAGLP